MNSSKVRVAIVGAGSWGCALAHVLANAGAKVTVFSASGKSLESLRTERKLAKLPVLLSERIIFSELHEDSFQNQDIVLIATKSDHVRTVAERLRNIGVNQPVVSLSKGLDPFTGQTMSEVLEEFFPVVAVLSGGSHAEEVVKGLPFSLTLGIDGSKNESGNLKLKELVLKLFHGTAAKIDTTTDRRGVEFAATIKNVIAIAVGIADGLQLGDNFRSALMVEGLKETAKLGKALNCRIETLYGNAGLGDLLATALSKHSRNRQFGIRIGEGYTSEKARESIGMVVEGLTALDGVLFLSKKLNVRVNFAEKIKRIIENKEPVIGIVQLVR